ncbi:MAG TPA: hypothetical protein VGN42_17125 [Pirellulales bacterium]|nr:hypothetical protein [Pirellulales bacterium]
MLTLVAAPIVLANFAPSDLRHWGFPMTPVPTEFEYGWPLIWYWRDLALKPGDIQPKWYVVRYGWLHLVGNLAIWSFILAATGTASELLQRRYRPALRWSLRRMLAAVAIIAVLCAWCAGLRQRARVQDPLIAEIEGRDGLVTMERWGPKWLDLVGAERFRRRIVGVQLYNYDNSTRGGLLNRLGRLPGLRSLYIDADVWTPEMVAALDDLRQLRALHLSGIGTTHDDYDDRFPHEIFAVVGKLKQLQVLSVSCRLISPDSLRRLADLTSLRSLRLVIEYNSETEQEMQHLVAVGKQATLADLPVLSRLEFMGFYGGLVRAEDLRHLASFRRLKALDFNPEFVTDGALVELASLESLEELAIGHGLVSARGLESLASLKRLARLHIPSHFLNEMTPLAVTDTGEVFVQQSHFTRCRRALEALRRANPGVAIDWGNSNPFGAYRTFDDMRADALFVHRWPH